MCIYILCSLFDHLLYMSQIVRDKVSGRVNVDPLLTCQIRRQCSMETSRNLIKGLIYNKVMFWSDRWKLSILMVKIQNAI